MEIIVFFKWLGATTLFIALLISASYWVWMAYNKFCSNWKFWVKYKLLKRKFDADVVSFLKDDLENGVNSDEMFKTILLSGKATPNQAEELKYIYKELQRRYKNE